MKQTDNNNNENFEVSTQLFSANYCISCDAIIEFDTNEEENDFGICKNCLHKIEYSEMTIDEVLNEFEMPIFLIDDEGIFKNYKGASNHEMSNNLFLPDGEYEENCSCCPFRCY